MRVPLIVLMVCIDPLCLYDVISLLKEGDHLRYHLGRMLTIAIQRNHKVAIRRIQASRQRGLMPKVACKLQHNDPFILLCQYVEGIYSIVFRAVIYIINCELVGQTVDHLTNVCIGLFNDPRLVVHRNHEIDFKVVFWRHWKNSTMPLICAFG
jgi:hypothetical protein